MEADLSDLSDSWCDTYSANFQINQINPLPFFFIEFAFDVFRTLIVFEIATPLFPHRYSINSP